MRFIPYDSIHHSGNRITWLLDSKTSKSTDGGVARETATKKKIELLHDL